MHIRGRGDARYQAISTVDVLPDGVARGAGDSAPAAIVASLLSGATEFEAAEIANLAASITIQQLGTTGTASPDQILDRFREATPKRAEQCE